MKAPPADFYEDDEDPDEIHRLIEAPQQRLGWVTTSATPLARAVTWTVTTGTTIVRTYP